MDKVKALVSENEFKKTFDIDGVPVIEVKIIYPVISEICPKAADRINRFYCHEVKKHIRFIENNVFPAASLEFKHTSENGKSFQTVEITAEYTVSGNSEKYISIYRDITEKAPNGKCRTARLSDTWDILTGWQKTAKAFTGRISRRKIIKSLTEKAEKNFSESGTQFYPEYKKLIKSNFSNENFCLSDSKITFFYNTGVIAPNFEGIISFEFCDDNN